MLANLGITDRNNVLLVTRLFKYVEQKEEPKVKVENFINALTKWADDNNYSNFRHAQNIRRALGNVLGYLQKRKMCDVVYEGETLKTVEFLESEKNMLNEYYQKLQKEPAMPFPDESNFPLKIPMANIFNLPASDISRMRLEEAYETRKIVRINIAETSSHVLVPPDFLYSLLPIVLRKIGFYLYPGQKTKALEDVARLLKGILPEKTIDAERVKKIFYQEERENPAFFIHAIETILSVLKNDRDDEKVKQPHTAIYLLKYYKEAEQNEGKEKEQEENKKNDKKTILNTIKNLDGTITAKELQELRDGSLHGKKTDTAEFGKNYSPNQFADLIDEVIHEYSVFSDGENSSGLLPPLIKLVSLDGTVFLVTRENILNVLENMRLDASLEISSQLKNRWKNRFVEFRTESEMSNDLAFDDTILKILEKKFKVLRTYLDNSPIIYNAIMESQGMEIKEGKSIMDIYFVPGKNQILRPTYQILELDRLNLYRSAYGAQPAVYRFFLTRVLLFLVSLFSPSVTTELPEEAGEGGGNAMSSPDAEVKEDSSSKRKKEISEFLQVIQNTIQPSSNSKASLSSLEAEWNQKIGEVREIVRDKVDKAIEKRSADNFKILMKSRAVSTQFIQRELSNMAMSMSVSAKYADITNKKAFRDYIMLTAIKYLQSKIK